MPGTTCLSCGQINMRGALICSNCGVLLETTVRVKPNTNTLRIGSDLRTQELGKYTAHEGKLSTHSIAFYLQDNPEPVIASLTSEMVIGRALANDNETPRFDLSPYNAQEKGVSRRHVILKRTPNGIVLEDMGSSNGTWVNGTLVLPFAPTPLQSGDHLRLGQFIMRIYLP